MFPPLVATVLTVYGIETSSPKKTYIPTTSSVATVLTVYGIETMEHFDLTHTNDQVATVLTVYGIETFLRFHPFYFSPYLRCNSTYRLRY